ncbi:HtaA domain-containing protein [Actinoplanes sp. NPDC049265]|uniref:HtaA domain-containing protein n=1 Tax=Actinoplanes sp. NPDC049265 TaxID=3363902 RepID=UPI0037223481
MSPGTSAPRTLRWGIKAGFLRHFSSSSGPDEGATLGPAGDVRFPLADAHDFDAGTGEGLLIFRGVVGFTGHLGLFSVRLADPWIDLAGDRGVLTVAAGRSGPGGRRSRIPIVEFLARRGGSRGVVVGAGVRLTHAGTSVFDAKYTEGEPFSDLYIGVPVAVAEPAPRASAHLSPA